MKKRILSILLCLCMVLTLFPVTAFAEGEASYPVVNIQVQQDGALHSGLTLEYRSTNVEGLTYTFNEISTGIYQYNGVRPGSYDVYVDNKKLSNNTISPGDIETICYMYLYTVTFDANGQEFTEETAPASQLCWNTLSGSNRKVTRPADPAAKDSDYRFVGWTVGPEKDSGAFDFATLISSKTVIYAQWERNTDDNTFPVTAERATITGSSSATRAEDYHATLVPVNGYELPFRETSSEYTTRTHIKIDGQMLNTANYTLNLETGELTIPGEYITGRVEIVTVPRQNPFIMHFNANGGTGTQEGEGAKVYDSYNGYEYAHDNSPMGYYYLPSCTFTPPEKKQFSHWNFGPNSSDVYNPGDIFYVYNDRTFYAVWKDKPEETYTVAYNLTGCDFSGSTNASNSSNYTTVITPKDGYTAPITLVSVQVGSSTLDSSAYTSDQNSETGALTLTIPANKITGNITITASAPAAHTHCICGGDTDVGGHTTHADVTFQPWGGTSAIDYGDDNTAYVCLTNDVTIQSNLEITGGKTLYLCLNGKTFASNGTNKIVVKENSRFILCDCAGGGTIKGATTGWGGTGIYLYNSTMDMYGGKITGGHAGNGGGGAIALDDVNCVFNMYGGEISRNKANRTGGAIFLNGTLQTEKGGTVNLYGGTISNNSAQIGGAIYSVYGGTVNLFGGEISGNIATAYGGGAICLNHSGVLNMTGGKMQNNMANTDGGAVNLYASTFTFSGGTISNNDAGDYGGAVYLSISSTLNMTGGEICNNTADAEGGAVHVYGKNATFNFSGGTITGNEAEDGGAVYLNQENSTLNMTGGEISGNKASGNGGAVYLFRETSTLNLSGGTIKNNTADSSGGAVYFNTTSDGKIQGILNISGNPAVKNNTVSDKANNIAMKTGKMLSIVGAMTDGASVGITTQSTDYPVVFSNAYDTDYSGYFFADDENAHVNYNSEKKLELAADVPAPTATVGNVTVSGTTGTAITDTEVTVTLNNDNFASTLSGNWITNLPAGLTQNVSRTDDTHAKITVSGTPTAASTAAMTIVIPNAQLVTSTTDLTVTANDNAKFNILPPTYTVTINAGANMTLASGNANQSGLSGAMTDTVYTAADGYYFPTDYAVAAVNGITVTRNSYTQITVSGTPTANTTITLDPATAKTKEDTPTATFDAQGPDFGNLNGISQGIKYSLDGGITWTEHTSSDTNKAIYNVSADKDIKVYKPASDSTKLDSDIQTIDVTKSATPTGVIGVACTTSENNDGKLQNVTTEMQYKKSDADDSSWTDCGGTEVTGLSNGTYYVRVKATGTALASDNQTVTVAAYTAPVHTHSWATEWSKDSTYHWHECTADSCDVTENTGKDGYGAHVYDDDADTTCNTCGYIRTVEPPAHTHSWAKDWSKNESHHWHECTAEGCDVTDNAQKNGYGAHIYDQQITTAEYKVSDATCTAKATYYKSCICGAKGTETFESGEVNASNHTFGAWIDEVSATCKTTGTKGHKDCTGCNKHFDAEGNEITDLTIPVDPNNHTFGDWQSNRLYHWKFCVTCGEKMKAPHVFGTDRTCDICGYVKPRTSNPTTPSQPTDTTTKSADTGDMGIALYTGMTILSLTGGAWVVNKKRKGK